MMKKLWGFLLIAACAHQPGPPATDKYLWLEEVEGPQALQWVETQNQVSQKRLAQTHEFQKMEKDALQILEATDKIPGGGFQKYDFVNFWNDANHVRGILRRVHFSKYKQKDIPWSVILDVDALAKKEKENWVFAGSDCLDPDYELCLIKLSRGGKDAAVVREFNQKKKAFVKNGFELPEAKSWVAWADRNHLLVATDFGPGTMTETGYPRQVKLWKRGTPLAQAKLILEVEPSDVTAAPGRMSHRRRVVLSVSRSIDFFNNENYIYDLKTGEKQKLHIPISSAIAGYYDGFYLVTLRDPWNLSGQSFPPGAVLAVNEKALGRDMTSADVQLIFTPQTNQSFSSMIVLKNKVVLSVLEDVKSRLMVTQLQGGRWQAPAPLNLPGNGDIKLSSGMEEKDLFLYYYESFNQPSALYSYDFVNPPEKLKSLPDRFQANNLQVEQKFATSRDGTKVPYFLVSQKGRVWDGTAPTLQYGYGGFTLSSLPGYNPLVGKLWLEKGGVYVVANIRGGGEYGPRWHQAALKENRQKAYDDFIAVSEDLIRTKVTSPAHLAISGRSNGGLLVGAVITQRPDLYGAVICGVPLLDMLRYNQLLAGASWVSEYGDPNVEPTRSAILKYSPYQNVDRHEKYPPIFLYTSTKDDRVHPGHARKMTAKLKEKNQPVLYYENVEGGHAGSANLKQLAKVQGLMFEFLNQTIAPKKAEAPKPRAN